MADLAKASADLDTDEAALKAHLTELQAAIQDTIGKLNHIAGARALVERFKNEEAQDKADLPEPNSIKGLEEVGYTKYTVAEIYDANASQV
jgi:hypothetical protein